MISLRLSLLALVTAALAQNNATCYYPDGSNSHGTACFGTTVSACCGPGFICLGTGLCAPGADNKKSYTYPVYRSACTDQTFEDSACPRYCLSSDDNQDAGQGIAQCSDGSYCCGRAYDCCTNTTSTFKINAATTPVTTIPYGPSTTSSSKSATSTTVTTTGAAAATTAPSASSSTTASSASQSSSHSVAIGVGVGVGVGAAILLVGVLLFFLRRRRQYKGHSKVAGDAAELSALDVEHSHNRKRDSDSSNTGLGSVNSPIKSPGLHDKKESSAIAMHELDGKEAVKPVEMEHTPRYEMGGLHEESKTEKLAGRDYHGPTELE